MSRFLRTAGFVAFAAFALAQSAQALDVVWDDGAAPDHSLVNPLNWSGDAYPLADDHGYIQNGYTANLAAEAASFKKLYVGDDSAAGLPGAGTLNVMAGGSLTLTNTTGGATGGALIISDAASASPVLGTVNISGGSLTTNQEIRVGHSANSVGILNQTGGALSSFNATTPTTKYVMRLGYVAGAYGSYGIAGDATSDLDGIMVSHGPTSIGVLEQSGGTITIGATGIRVGNGSAAGSGTGLFNQTGGSATINKVLWAGGGYAGSWGQIELGGTATVLAAADGSNYVAVARHADGAAKGYLNLKTGGVLVAPDVRTYATAEAGGEAVFTFRGGTLKANASTSDPADPATHFMRMPAAAGGIFLGAEGGTIDTDGFDVVISDPLQAMTGTGVSAIAVMGGGEGYDATPVVQIVQDDLDFDGQRGRGATAVATVSGGAVTTITVTNPGAGYDPDDPVTVTIVGGGATPGMEAYVGAVDRAANAADGGLTKSGLGMLTLAGANTYAGLTSVQGGTLRVTGSLVGNVTVADAGAWSGNHAAGADPNVAGNLNMSAGGDMLWKLAALADNATGTAGVDFDQSTIAGSLSLGATSALTLDFASLAEADRPDAATPNAFWTADHTWTILDAASATGNFTDWINATFASGSFSTTLDTLTGSILLNYVYNPVAQIPGDTNLDLVVDAEDAKKLAQHWGEEIAGGNSVGDFNDDGWVNAIDASILAANWGDHRGSESSSAVPEPSTLAAILAGLLIAACLRRKS